MIKDTVAVYSLYLESPSKEMVTEYFPAFVGAVSLSVYTVPSIPAYFTVNSTDCSLVVVTATGAPL